MLQHVKKSALCLLYINEALLTGRLVGEIVVPLLAVLLRLFEGLNAVDRLAFDRILRGVGIFLSAGVALFLVFFRSANDEHPKHFHLKHVCFFLLASFGIQFALSALFRFSVFFTGSAYYLAQLIHLGGLPVETPSTVPTPCYAATTLVCFLLYFLFSLLGAYVGHRKAVCEREELLKQES
ncbi:MAG: hypothetical protein II328_00815 [Clostridia bacterium]|nr:hypothetical protein [Clostridia bacterium]